ncbi:TPA_asm: hypothetical protein [ssRNA phage Esthiorhiza.2_50]|jgi:hypothetical protein|uniref:Uncharacterized protein n=2 Tax=Leviviricetes TaxID=2842243 RepID=A0A8S5L333_9VIRU|nr:hypothetical protein QIP15_gp4 [ssRNA phage Esthiorhiza.2_50]QDH89334.1 MAG: hypothetical protein H2RhizoLitter8242_000003 [Leviviridae sp.]DAD51828.1 TPA_asm: hypothetical protein [ssRNA phage Esthiorhiza.2_50]
MFPNPGGLHPREAAAFFTCRLANARWMSVEGNVMRYIVIRCLDDFLIEDSRTGGWIYVEEMLSELGYSQEAKAYQELRPLNVDYSQRNLG